MIPGIHGLLCFFFITGTLVIQAQPSLSVRQTEDFTVNGQGSHQNWQKAEWIELNQLDSGSTYASRFKIMYSSTGIYTLFEGEDKKVTTAYKNDFENLFNGDVFEVFFHSQPADPVYFEYEINALNKELVLLIPNFSGRFLGWVPWNYRNERKVQKKVHQYKKDGQLEKWTAEMFFPYGLLAPLQNVPPTKGMQWKANFYRLDYDGGKMIKWAWSPVERTFHEYSRFGTLIFE